MAVMASPARKDAARSRGAKSRGELSGLDAEQLYTVAQVATVLNFHTRTVLKKLASGELVGVHIGRTWRVRGRDVETYIRNNLSGDAAAK